MGQSLLEAAARASVAGRVELPEDSLLNMELSALVFNERVLSQVSNPEIPLLEQVRFLSIVGSNLDEFYMTRVAGFKRQVAFGSDKRTLDGLSPEEQLRLIGVRARLLFDTIYQEVLPPLLGRLRAEGIEIPAWGELKEGEAAYLQRNYCEAVERLVMPVAIVRGAPFPHIRNLRPTLLLRLAGEEAGSVLHRLVVLTGEVPRLIPLPGGRRFVLLEEVIRAVLPRVLPGAEILGTHLCRITRSGNLELEADETDDILQQVAENVARRPFQTAVRIEVSDALPVEGRRLLLEGLKSESDTPRSFLDEGDVYEVPGLIDLRALERIAELPISRLRYPPARHRTPLRREPSVFEQIRSREILIRFPRHSYEKTIERFIAQSAVDPHVEAIRVTLYRTEASSRIVDLLQRAHHHGKKVTAMVEVKASFDERRNMEWARELEASGITVFYGLPSLKVHAKIACVTRREEGQTSYYSFIGTGNLNAATAAAYTDLGLLTANQEYGRTLEQLFAVMGGADVAPDLGELLVAPFNMRGRFIELIRREVAHARAGRDGAIMVKVNGLADRGIIAALYKASQAGVRIDLIVRGICSLRPGVPGLSEGIRVVALVGRYLEHSRIFRFDNAGAPDYFIGSADWRGRNLSRRVEVAVPVHTPAHRRQLDAILRRDLEKPTAWDMRGDGSFVRRSGNMTTGIVESGHRPRHSR